MSLIKHWWRAAKKIPSGQVFGFIFGIILIYLCFALAPGPYDVSRNILITVVGVLFGWPVGVYFTPFNKRDAKRLHNVGKSLAAFVSGYLLSKVEPIIHAQVAEAAANINVIPWPQLGLFVSGFILSAVLVFEGRAYLSGDDEIQKKDG